MIIGIGTDLVEVSRIASSIEKYGDRFKNRIFTKTEQEYCDARPKTSALHYAARFAVKEAFSKAIGTGAAQGFVWSDIGVRNEPSGKPVLELSGVLKERWEKYKLHVTISHTQNHAVGVVVIEEIGS